MKNRDRILHSLDEIAKRKKEKGVSTQEIAETIHMDRTLVSRYLNQMVNDGILIKSGERPVLYSHGSSQKTILKTQTEKNGVFNEFIGVNGSLEKQIKQCIASIRYPKTGLPLILTGNSGVGKSYLASLIYQYAVEENIVSKNAKFIIFNCADYANNAELLASKLFGYKKGAFTDATEDYEGVISQANGGYLFLDEVHRLSPEGQEKLFILLDKGVFQPFGDKNYYSVNVRLICATTENLQKTMIQTFLRRIPIQIHLPDLKERLVSERLEFIKRFYINESIKLKKSIKVSNKVMNYLMSCNLEGNIGELRNIIKVSCANAFDTNYGDDMIIDTKDILMEYNRNTNIKKYFKEDYLELSLEEKKRPISPHSSILIEIINIFRDMYYFLEKDILKLNTDEEIIKKISDYYKRINDITYYENVIYSNVFYDQLLYIHIKEGLQMLHDCYGVHIMVKSSKDLANMFYILRADIFKSEEVVNIMQSIFEKLKTIRFKYIILADRFFDYLDTSISYKASIAERLFFMLQIIIQFFRKEENYINVIILAHGDSTASSIASVVNRLFSDYIIEAFDMSIDMKPLDIVEDIKKYAEQLKKGHSAIFLVDMGSLFEIYPLIKDYFKGDVVVINNITTQLAILVGSLIYQKKHIWEIIDQIISNSELHYKYYERSAKRKVIVTTDPGIDTAKQMKNLIKNCLLENEDMIDVITCDYFSLKDYGRNYNIFEKYDVLLVVTTLGLHITGVRTIIFSEMLTENNKKILMEILGEIYDYKSIEKIFDNLMKSLTLENILSKITILNPSRVVDKVSIIISEMEKSFEFDMPANQKLSMYIHMAVMLERCFFHKSKNSDSYIIVNDKKHLHTLREIFNDNMSDFEIEIPDWELDMIFKMINEYNEYS